MIWMLDTNIMIYFINRKPGFERVARRISGRSPGEVRLSAITLAELRYGMNRSAFPKENHAALDAMLHLVETDDFPAGAALDFGEIRKHLEDTGKSIGPYDLLIAAHARHIGAMLVTNNEREFRRVPKLSLENWAKT